VLLYDSRIRSNSVSLCEMIGCTGTLICLVHRLSLFTVSSFRTLPRRIAEIWTANRPAVCCLASTRCQHRCKACPLNDMAFLIAVSLLRLSNFVMKFSLARKRLNVGKGNKIAKMA
jgi:hypothetical protein